MADTTNTTGFPNTPNVNPPTRPYPEQAPGHPDKVDQIVRRDYGDSDKVDQIVRRDYGDYPDQQAPKVPPVDHLTEIEQLARRNSTTSPSGAETLCQQILVHVQALRDPAGYDKAEAEKRAADDKENARQAKITAERKATYQVPESHRGAQGTAQPDQRLP